MLISIMVVVAIFGCGIIVGYALREAISRKRRARSWRGAFD